MVTRPGDEKGKEEAEGLKKTVAKKEKELDELQATLKKRDEEVKKLQSSLDEAKHAKEEMDKCELFV